MNQTRFTSILVLLASLLLAAVSFLTSTPEPASGAVSGPRVRDFLGVNVGDRSSSTTDIGQVAGWVRDYHRWYNYEPTNDNYTFNTLDGWYGGLHAAGVNVLATVEFAPSWSSSDGTTTGNPYYKGDGTQFSDYAEHAEYMAQFAARFGATKYPANDSRIETTDKVTGLGYVEAMESYNEPDYWWWTPTFPAAKYAKMLQADYNGYGTTTSSSLPIIGAKKADPGMTVVHGGLLSADTAYLEGVLLNAAPNQIPFDTVNYHIMMARTPNVGGTSPEAGPFRSSIASWKAWRDAHTPGKPIWITEIGWDTYNNGSTYSKIWAPELSAANYLLRTMALGMGNGLDRMFIYMYKDALVNSTTQYMSMGLVKNTGSGEGTKKAGWYYMATAMSLLGDYRFDHIERDGTGATAVYSYIFSKPETGERVTMIWCRDPNSPVDNGTKLSNFRVTIPGAQAATLIVPTNGLPAGQQSALTVLDPGTTKAGVVLSTVEERPQFIYYKPTGTPIPLPTSTQTATPTYQPSQGNMLANPGFELAGSGNQPLNWTVSSWATSSVVRSDANHLDGNYSMLFQPSSGSSYTVTQDVAIPAGGGSYTFSGWVLIPSSTGSFNLAIQLQAFTSANGLLSTVNAGQAITTVTGSQWMQIQGSIAAPSSAARLRILIKMNSPRATVYLDQFSLADATAPTATSTSGPAATATPTASIPATNTPTPTATSTPVATSTPTAVLPLGANVLSNPGMEVDANGDNLPDSWDPHWPSTGTVLLSNESAHSGVRSLRNSPTSGRVSYVVQQDMAVSGGKSYNFSGWVNIPAMTDFSRFSFQIQPLTSTGGSITGVGPTTIASYTTTNGGWQEATGSVTLPNSAGRARIIMRFENFAGKVYLDDMNLSLAP